MDEINILNSQLTRIRQMNNFYHKQFLLDVRLLFFFTVIFFYLSRTNINALLIIPFLSLFGSVLLSFHAHYLIFTRNYSQFLEEKINKINGNDVLIGHKLENSYLFPIQDRKIVVAKLGSDFTWFGFVTLFITFLGISAYIFALRELIIMKYDVIYLFFLVLITLVTLFVGIWWFLLGNGEKKLEKVFYEYR